MFDRNITEMMPYSLCNLSKWRIILIHPITDGVHFDYLIRWCLPSFPTVKLLSCFLLVRNTHHICVWGDVGYIETLKYITSYWTFHLFMIVFISIWTHVFLFYSGHHNLLISLFILRFKLFLIWPMGAHSRWLLYFWHVLVIIQYFLYLYYNRIYQAHLVLSLPQHWS